MMPALAKPTGITLQDHTRHVVNEAKTLLNARGQLVERKYMKLTGENLRAALLRAAEHHDKGKLHEQWQQACRKDYEAYRQLGCVKGRHLLKAGIRHEFASLDWARRKRIELSLPERVAIAAHHGKLSFRHEHRWLDDDNGRFKPLWEEYCGLAYQWVMEPERFRKTLLERYRISAVRALLQLADTRASRREAKKPVPDIEPFQHTFPYIKNDGSPSYRGVQQVIQTFCQTKDERELILRAPTGSGKTDAALLWARHQIEQGRADRLIVAMPTRFTSNALALNIDRNVSDTGLYHSSAWFKRFGDTDDRDAAKELHRMARLLVTPVTVCTIDHLCIALTGRREDHHAIFFNLANACVVIDEADFYDPFVQANIVVLLDALRLLEVPFMIMSATVPESARKLYAVERLEEDTSDLTRPRCHIEIAGKAEVPSDVSPLLEKALDEKAVIVYANTVARALAYYDWFTGRGRKPILYHARFTEPDKARIEDELITALGHPAWKEERASGIAIMTQIGEMSINISAPFMISDLCPFDRLAQRAGRLSRFEGMAAGLLHVVVPVREEELYPAPYGEYLLREKRWRAGRALLETMETLKPGCYTAQDFMDAVNDLYPSAEAFADYVLINQDELRREMNGNWLIVPQGQVEEDADETPKWRSRDIPPERTVLTHKPPEHFFSYDEFRRFELESGISCPIWEVSMGEKLGRVRTVQFTITNDQEEKTMPFSPCYSRHEGLILNQNRQSSARDAFI